MENASTEPLYRETTKRFLFLRLVTEVRTDGLYVRLAPLQRSFRQISPDRIQSVAVASYNASSYAGWHWGIHRNLGGNTVYRLRGDRGVEIRLQSGERWFIGSQQPERVESAINRIATTGN